MNYVIDLISICNKRFSNSTFQERKKQVSSVRTVLTQNLASLAVYRSKHLCNDRQHLINLFEKLGQSAQTESEY